MIREDSEIEQMVDTGHTFSGCRIFLEKANKADMERFRKFTSRLQERFMNAIREGPKPLHPYP